jgi:hypothetical protein
MGHHRVIAQTYHSPALTRSHSSSIACVIWRAEMVSKLGIPVRPEAEVCPAVDRLPAWRCYCRVLPSRYGAAVFQVPSVFHPLYRFPLSFA